MSTLYCFFVSSPDDALDFDEFEWPEDLLAKGRRIMAPEVEELVEIFTGEAVQMELISPEDSEDGWILPVPRFTEIAALSQAELEQILENEEMQTYPQEVFELVGNQLWELSKKAVEEGKQLYYWCGL